jgi:hypothetical protein
MSGMNAEEMRPNMPWSPSLELVYYGPKTNREIFQEEQGVNPRDGPLAVLA